MYYINGSYYDPDTGTYMNASPISDTINGAYLTRSIDRNGLMCNNVVEFANARREETNLFGYISTMSANMLQAVPWYFWLVNAGINASATFAPVFERAIWGWSKDGRLFLDFHYSADRINRFTVLDELRSPLDRVSQGIGYLLIAIDLGLNIYNSVQQGYSWAQGITSFALTAAKDIGVYFLSAAVAGAVGKYVGAKLGTAIGSAAGPVGMIVGAAIGFGVGLLVDWLGTMFIDWLVGKIK